MAYSGADDANDEFDGDIIALQQSAEKRKSGKMTRLEQLEHEMKLLSWHKLANEAALKAAIIRTKNLKKHDRLQLQKDRNRERAAWMEQIIREEQMKPLEVNTHFVKEYEQKEKEADAALERTIEHHLHNLRKLKKMIESKDVIRQRKEKFYAKRAEVRAMLSDRAKTRAANATTRGPRSNTSSNNNNNSSKCSSSNQEESNALTTTTSPPGATEKGPPQSMSLVVGSLDKLMKLESRINKLEESMREKAKMEQRKAGTLSQLGMLRFRKKRIQASLRSPATTRFSVSMHPGNNPLNPANHDNEEEEDDGSNNEGNSTTKVNNWIKERKQQLKAQRKKRQKRALANRRKAKAMGSRNARSAAADFKQMKRNDPRLKTNRRKGGTTLPPIRGSRRKAW